VLQLPHIQCEGGYCCDSNVSLFNLWSIGNLYWIILIFNTRIISFSFSLWVIFLILLMFHLSQFENASLWNTWLYGATSRSCTLPVTGKEQWFSGFIVISLVFLHIFCSWYFLHLLIAKAFWYISTYKNWE
jgi:hypothetical protein